MYKAALGVLLAAMSLHVRAALAQFYTGNDLLEFCAGNNVFNQGVCVGFIIGVARAAEPAPLARPTLFCFPAGVSVRQLKDVAVAYLQKTPELRHLDAAGLVGTALFEAFPCKR
jgi:hypothetical protein